jgi:hypothetical protein
MQHYGHTSSGTFFEGAVISIPSDGALFLHPGHTVVIEWPNNDRTTLTVTEAMGQQEFVMKDDKHAYQLTTWVREDIGLPVAASDMKTNAWTIRSITPL